MRSHVPPPTVSAFKHGGKGKRKGFYLNHFLDGKKYKNQKKSKVRFNDFISRLPSNEGKKPDYHWEKYVYRAIKQMVVACISRQIGELEPSNRCPWEVVYEPRQHPLCETEDDETIDSEYNGIWWEDDDRDNGITFGQEEKRLEQTFGDAFWIANTSTFQWEDDSLYDMMGPPIACAFLHRTEWTNRIRNFKRDSGTWSDQVKERGGVFIRNGQMKVMIKHWANDACDVVVNNTEKFWLGFDDAFCALERQFKLTVDFYVGRVSDLIQKLDDDFKNEYPSTLDALLSRRSWELLVLDWINEKPYQAYLYFYGTPGEFFYYKDFSKWQY
jgi:hypothetical protein